MKTRLILLFCTLAIAACTAVPKRLVLDTGERGESYAYAAAHTYRVNTLSGVGSGWAWDHDTIITNRHVVLGDPLIFTHVLQGRQRWEVARIEYIDGMDVALIDVIGPPLTVAPIRAFGLKVGEFVSMSGHPHATPEPVVTWGYVAGRWFWGDMVIDGAIIPGMSGGPVIDEDGKIVGMNVATTTPPGRALGIVIDIADIIEGIANDTLDQPQPRPEGIPLGGGGCC